jgi:uncharacterized protein YggE
MRPPHSLLVSVASAFAVLGLTLAVPRWSGPAVVAAQDMPGEAAHGLTVIAMGQARGQPDQATLHLGVTTERPTAADALSETSTGVQAVLAGMDGLGISRSVVQTGTVSLVPIWEDPDQRPNAAPPAQANPEQRITGYRATSSLTVRVSDISRVGEVLDGAVAAGANQVLGIQFGLADPDSLRTDALRDAVQDARNKAQAIASPLGLRVGEVINVQEVGGPVQGRMDTAFAPAAASTPIEPGQLQFRAQVEVTFDVSPTSS